MAKLMRGELVAGIDDFGTMMQLCEGWSYFILPRVTAPEFAADARALLPVGVNEFHGKKFKLPHTENYRAFLALIWRSLEKYPESMARTTLSSLDWKRDFLSFCQNLISGIYHELSIGGDGYDEVSGKLFAPLATMQRLLREHVPGARIAVEVDADDTLEAFPELIALIRGNEFTIESILTRLNNRYREHRFPGSPSLVENGISIVKGSKSAIIQAADVIGNFSLCYMYYRLDAATDRQKIKAGLFEEIFGDAVESSGIVQNCEIVDGEIRLKRNGALTLAIG